MVLGKYAYDMEESTGVLRDDGDGLEDNGGGFDEDWDRFEEFAGCLEKNVGGNGFELLEENVGGN